MEHCVIDHLVVAARSLEEGAAHVEKALGVSLQPGGEHPLMGTHNRLLSLGETSYLEVISPCPNLKAPSRPRWFGLDHLEENVPPRLVTWVARTGNIEASLENASEPLGTAEPMFRGALNWSISLTGDGSLPLGGPAPALIQWDPRAVHPASRLEFQGLSLERLSLFTPQPERLSRLLDSLHLDGPVTVNPLPFGETPRLEAHIHTPKGLRVLG